MSRLPLSKRVKNVNSTGLRLESTMCKTERRWHILSKVLEPKKKIIYNTATSIRDISKVSIKSITTRRVQYFQTISNYQVKFIADL